MQGTDTSNLYDVVIIGAGPAGLSAALFLARACYRIAVVEKESQGGLASIVREIVDYPGITSISGPDLMKSMREHAASFGAEFITAGATALRNMENDIKTVVTTAGELNCYGVLLATGARPKSVGFKGEAAFRGKGISYTATIDAEFFTGKEIFVIGSGTEAAEDCVFLTKYASHVTVLVPAQDYTCDYAFWEKAQEHPNITIYKNTRVEEVSGDTLVRRLVWHDLTLDKAHVFEPESGDTFGIFILVGHEPATRIVRGLIELDAYYYVPVDSRKRTSLTGLYAAGDVCSYTFRQVLTAASDGAIAANSLIKYVYRMQSKVGLVPVQNVRRASVHKTVDSSEGNADEKQKSVFTPEMLSQLQTTFMDMERDLILHIFPDDSEASRELERYMNALSGFVNGIEVVTDFPDDTEKDLRPYVRVEYTDGSYAGFSFHGMPGGNEFTSFVLGLYNASCHGQHVEDEVRQKIESIGHDLHFTVLVTLTCTMCPDLVSSVQRLATLNPHITCDVYDLNHFPQLREKYNVMSVPCYFINDGPLMFGKKTVEQLSKII